MPRVTSRGDGLQQVISDGAADKSHVNLDSVIPASGTSTNVVIGLQR